MTIEQLNRIEVRGNVGTVNILKVGQRRVAHFSVATDFIYKGRNGDAVIETTWHNVTAWEGKNIPNLDFIKKGSPMKVCGRMRSQKYTGSDGIERISYEIVASSVESPSDSGASAPASADEQS